jgi:serine/threonine-protein kinase
MTDVFVSYKAEDRRRVKPLVEALQADGYSVWWDEQIGGGAAWRHAIETELDAAQCVIVVWSNRSVGPDGTFVQDEATRAQQRHVYVPVLIDKVHLPLGFGETQALPLAGWKGNRSDPRYHAVVAAVRRLAGDENEQPAPRHADYPPLSRRLVLGGGAATAVAVAGIGAWTLLKPSPAAASRSIAVLPFANLSGDPAQAYFSDGIAEELRSALGRIAGLEVVGRTSSEAVRNDDAGTAAKKLGVANILTGSVRQSPSTVRVSAELIDGKTGMDRWSQDYDRSPGDAIKIQTDIAANVATALSAALGRVARAAIAVGGTSNAAAQNLYLKSKAQLKADDSEASLRSGISLLDSAIALDPKFADAYALKSRALADLDGYFTARGGRFEAGFVEAAAVAQQAISLAPDLAAGHVALAYIRLSQLDMGAAAMENERGHSVAGGDADDLLAYANFITLIGRSDEALNVARQAQNRDPLNARAYGSEGGILARNGHYPEAADAYRKALALAPNLKVYRSFLGLSLMKMGRLDEALTEFRKLPPDYLFRMEGEAMLFARQGNRAASDAALQHAQQVFGDAAHFQYAEVYAQRGEKDRAFAALDRAWNFRDPGLAYLKADDLLAGLRSEPRFTALLRKMNFPA